MNTKVEETTQEDKKNQPSTENQTSTELADKEVKPEKETPQIHNQSETKPVVEPSENKESEKPELPMTKQENYQLHYDQPTAPSYDGWEKQALPVGNGEMGAKVFGLIGEERIQYNEKTLWSGGPQPDSTDYNGGNYQDRYKVLAEIRKALEEGNRQKSKTISGAQPSRTKQCSVWSLLIFW